MVWECLRKLNDFGEGIKDTLLGVSDHMDSEGNKKANALVRKGATTPLIGSDTFCGSGDMFFKGETGRWQK